MATKTVTVKVVGDASSARKALGSVATETEKLGSRAGKAFGALANLAGQSGAFGPLAEVMSKVGEGLDYVAENGKRAGTIMIGAGGAAAAAGVLMTRAAEKDVVAHKQLRQAVENSGHSYAAYEGQIKQAITSQEKFGHTADETQDALRKLTDATGDPAKALRMMGLVADIAASKHIALADAAALVAKILNGTGGKALAAYGIHIDKSKDQTQELNRALTELSQKTGGQAAASADTLGGKWDAMSAKAKDVANSIGAKLGPALTAAGAAVATLGTLMEIGIAVKGAYSAATVRLAAAQTAAATAAANQARAEALSVGATAAMAETAAVAAAANARLATSSSVAAAAAGRLGASSLMAGKALGAAAAVGALTWGAKELADTLSNRASPSVAKLATDLDHLAATGRRGAELDKFFGGGQFEKDFKLATDSSLWGSLRRGLGDYVDKVGPAASALQVFGGSAADAKERNTQLAASLAQLKPEVATAAFERLTAGMNPAATERYKAALIALNPALDAVLNASTAAAPGIDKVAGSSRAASVSLGSAADKAAYLGRVFSTLAGNMSVDTAIMAAAQATRDLTASLKENGKSFDISTVNGAANRAALINVAKANLDVRDQMLKIPGGAHAANVAYEQSTLRLRAQMTQAHFTKDQIDKLVGRYQTVPKTVSTVISAVDRVTPAVTYIKRQLQGMDGKVYTVTTRLVTQRISTQGGTTKFSAGGPVMGGTPGMDSVNALLTPREFVVRADGSNLPDAMRYFGKDDGKAAGPRGGTASAGGTVVNFYISGALDPLAVGRQVEQALMKVKRVNGGLAFQ